MLKHIDRRWLRIVLASQCAVAAVELLHYLHCDADAFDCTQWQWLFDYILNYPLSPLLESGLATLSGTFAAQPAAVEQGLRFAAYVVAGTAWWTLLGSALKLLWSTARQRNEGPQS